MVVTGMSGAWLKELMVDLEMLVARAHRVEAAGRDWRCWQARWVKKAAFATRAFLALPQGRLAEARLTLRSNPQLHWSGCGAERSGGR